jgi:hypothetical protein
MEISDINFYLANTEQERGDFRTHVIKGARYYEGRNWRQYCKLVRYAIDFFLNEFIVDHYKKTTYSKATKNAVLEAARKEASNNWLSPTSRFAVECLFSKMPATRKPLSAGEEIVFLTRIIEPITEMFDVHLLNIYSELQSRGIVKKAELPLLHPMAEAVSIPFLEEKISMQESAERSERANILRLEAELNYSKSKLAALEEEKKRQLIALHSFMSQSIS